MSATASGGPQLRRAAHRPLLAGERLQASDEVRSCSYPGCEARLSRYNPDTLCAAHGGWGDRPTRRVRRSSSGREPYVLGPES